MYRAHQAGAASEREDWRPMILHDLKLLAPAEAVGIPVILTKDRNALSRLGERRRRQGCAGVRVRLLAEAFTAGRLDNPVQDEPNLSSPPPPR